MSPANRLRISLNEASTTVKLIYLAFIIFNFFALVMVFNVFNFTVAMLQADVAVIVTFKLEQCVRYLVTKKYQTDLAIAQMMMAGKEK